MINIDRLPRYTNMSRNGLIVIKCCRIGYKKQVYQGVEKVNKRKLPYQILEKNSRPVIVHCLFIGTTIKLEKRVQITFT